MGDLRIVSSGFVAALARSGAFDRMLGDFRRVPLAQPQVRISATALIGYSAAEGQARPISRLNLVGAPLERRRRDCIVLLSEQLAESMTAGAQGLLARELRNGVIGATDATFLAALADGVSLLPSDGGSAANVLADLDDMLAAVPTDASSKLYLVVSATVAKRLTAKATTTGARAFPEMGPQGGRLAGIPVIVSDHLPLSGSPAVPPVMLIDASQIAADSEVVELDIATHASVEMTDGPTMSVAELGSPSAPTASQVVSLWQTNSRGVRASRYYGFRKLRDDAVAVLDGGAW